MRTTFQEFDPDHLQIHGDLAQLYNNLISFIPAVLSDAIAANTLAITANTDTMTAHEAKTVNVHGVPNTVDLATKTQVDAVQASLLGAVGYDPTEVIFTDDERYFRGSIWRATQDLPAGIPPTGLGNGTPADRNLLLERRAGFAHAVTGGLDHATITVHNANDTGAGSLRQAIADAQAADGGWIVFDPTFNSGVYAITLGSELCIAGLNAHNITIDGRAATVTINGAGSPGPSASGNGGITTPGTGVPGYGLHIGSFGNGSYSAAFTAVGNTEPANNIIVTGIAFISNFGGEHGDNADHRVMDVLYWARDIWLDHLSLTNPDYPPDAQNGEKNTDEALDIGYGATNVTVSWCHFYEHWKNFLINGHSVPVPPLPPGVSAVSPGPYAIVKDSTGTVDVVRSDVTIHHCWMDNLALRGPAARGPAVHLHVYNDWNFQWGAHKDIGGTGLVDDYNQPTVGNPYTGGHTPNSGNAIQIYGKADAVIENTVFTPYPNSSGNGKNACIHETDGSVKGQIRETGNLYENGASSLDAPFNATTFVPTTVYSYALETPDGALKTRLQTSAGAHPMLWAYVSAGTVTTTIDVKNEGTLIGAASQVDIVGTGINATWDGIDKATLTVNAGAADPTDFILVGTSLPTPGSTYLAKRFRVVNTLDAPTTGTEYECRHNTGLNVWEWQQVAGSVVPAVIPGQELAHVAYHPTATQTTATTTSTTAVDVSASAITASWTGVSASTFDCVFTTPPNRVVLVEIEALMNVTTAKKAYFALYNVGGAAAITNTQSYISNTASILRLIYRKRLDSTVLPSAGTSFTIRPQWLTEASSTLSAIVGGINGPFRVRVLAAL